MRRGRERRGGFDEAVFRSAPSDIRYRDDLGDCLGRHANQLARARRCNLAGRDVGVPEAGRETSSIPAAAGTVSAAGDKHASSRATTSVIEPGRSSGRLAIIA